MTDWIFRKFITSHADFKNESDKAVLEGKACKLKGHWLTLKRGRIVRMEASEVPCSGCLQ